MCSVAEGGVPGRNGLQDFLDAMAEVFISYASKDATEFALKLPDALTDVKRARY